MIEQHVADRFRDAVADEPPLGFDPDQVIDRAVKHTRRRRVVLAVAAATMVEAVAVWAFSGISGVDGQVTAARPGPGPAPAQPPASQTSTMTIYEQTLILDSPLDLRPADAAVQIHDLHVRNPDGDRGTVALKRADQVVFEIALEHFRDYDMHFNEPVVADPGVPIRLAVNCTASLRDCRGVSLTYTGYTLVREH